MFVLPIKVALPLSIIVMICTASSSDDQTGEVLRAALIRPIMEYSNATAACRRDNEIYSNALANDTPWAIQMYDASVKSPSGILTGNSIQFGNYDECLEVRSSDFVGKACIATIIFRFRTDPKQAKLETHFGRLMHLALSKFQEKSPYDVLPFQWLWCLPSSCDHRDFSNFLKSLLMTLTKGSDIRAAVEVDEDACHTVHTEHYLTFDAADWFYLSVLMMFGVVIIFSTAYDLFTNKNVDWTAAKGLEYSIITAHSLYTNGKSLMSTKRSTDAIKCLDSIRFFSICCITYSHFMYFVFTEPQLNATKRDTILEHWTSALTVNTFLAVDTFLLLSGILLTYNELGKRRTKHQEYRFEPLKYYTYRYVRVTSPYAIMIGFHATIFYKIGTGPWWNHFAGIQRNICLRDWWRNLLYINSFDRPICMWQSWYLSVDMLLNWIAPIFFYPLINKGIKHVATICIFSVGIIAVILSTFLVTYWKHLPAMVAFMYAHTPENKDYFAYLHTRFYTRAGPFLVGLIVGYLLRTYQNNSPKIKVIWIICGWTVAISTTLAVVFGPRKMYHRDYKYDPLEAAFYNALHKIAFSLSVGWMIVATQFGYSGPLGSFLNWSGWVPFSKLTYCTYLTHLVVFMYDIGTIRTPRIYSTWTLVKNYVALSILTFIPSVVLCLCFEMPFIRLIRCVRGGSEDAASVISSADSTLLPEFGETADADHQSVYINADNFRIYNRKLKR